MPGDPQCVDHDIGTILHSFEEQEIAKGNMYNKIKLLDHDTRLDKFYHNPAALVMMFLR